MNINDVQEGDTVAIGYLHGKYGNAAPGIAGVMLVNKVHRPFSVSGLIRYSSGLVSNYGIDWPITRVLHQVDGDERYEVITAISDNI